MSEGIAAAHLSSPSATVTMTSVESSRRRLCTSIAYSAPYHGRSAGRFLPSPAPLPACSLAPAPFRPLSASRRSSRGFSHSFCHIRLTRGGIIGCARIFSGFSGGTITRLSMSSDAVISPPIAAATDTSRLRK